ncbi:MULTISPECIES: potassium-transporting ATPase subunit KdpC [Staphylococcus]|uniref:Potassium-transporting ATPase KdpC subunit n=1 Tax=Staphylococcus schleiferi TaxID=1295 RepID=A0A7Z7QRB5_STASC|nr:MULTISPECIES: potassium-transporting ATPase subunit KdpC [Staphylococcus]QGS46898.1 potassium-transporting ATPase subunit KdpC [Mammaliicoccus fleurettii]EPD53422.1 K+-transporting ATPase, C subunit [Staphylococcus sp. HGB0015]MBF1993160.1 potassium-transporting ATPase subunit KdpC [Staphylococcus schleiferi]MBF2038632.1 potassium-transporting ATPase subunit KdpC [Staphylococcus schleiferi]MBF2100529.1 potassium-transporting ATPase subunit KdpC [Staphylococcus schleiferi]
MKAIRSSIGLVVMTMVLCGVLFPLAVTAVGQTLFHHQANGSLVTQNGKVVGSNLIGQQWNEPQYFHGRTSAVKYNMDKTTLKEKGVASGSDNYSNGNPELKKRVEDLKQDDGHHTPIDAVTESGSGLDPDITVDNAKQQVARIAKQRNLSPQQIDQLITKQAHKGTMYDDYVNVLALNMALDHLSAH